MSSEVEIAKGHLSQDGGRWPPSKAKEHTWKQPHVKGRRNLGLALVAMRSRPTTARLMSRPLGSGLLGAAPPSGSRPSTSPPAPSPTPWPGTGCGVSSKVSLMSPERGTCVRNDVGHICPVSTLFVGLSPSDPRQPRVSELSENAANIGTVRFVGPIGMTRFRSNEAEWRPRDAYPAIGRHPIAAVGVAEV
jgi:hypothetical protein